MGRRRSCRATTPSYVERWGIDEWVLEDLTRRQSRRKGSSPASSRSSRATAARRAELAGMTWKEHARSLLDVIGSDVPC